MPKRSVFTQKTRVSRSRSRAPAPLPAVKAGAGIYEGMNEVSGWLRAMNTGLNTTFAGAPELLKSYIRNASITLHELMELMTTKLPKENSDDQPYGLVQKQPDVKPQDAPADAVAALQEIEAAYGGDMNKPNAKRVTAPKSVTRDVLNKLRTDLLSLGLIAGLHRLQQGRDASSKAWIAQAGSLRRAMMDLSTYWEDQRTTVCENNRHDPEEYRELREALQSDMDQAHAIINALV